MDNIIESNPLKILKALDGFLQNPLEIILFGRSALALCYSNPPAEFLATMDVDAILPSKDLQAIEANEDFWRAQDLVNQTLADSGLYFTHLFEERQVLLSSDWASRIVPGPNFGFKRLSLLRPSTHDLILTKMMRIDPQDRRDIHFLIQQSDFSKDEFHHCLKNAVCPNVPEIQEAFRQNTAWLLKLQKDAPPATR